MRVKDSLVNASSEASIAEMEVVYDTEKKQQEITLQKAQLSKKNFILVGSVLLFIAFILLGISYYRRIRLQQKAKLQTEIMKQQNLASRAIINAEEEERKRIARDLHDGVGQLMSAARMNLSAFATKANLDTGSQKDTLDKIITLVDEGCREIRQVSHEMIPNVLMKRSLASAIQDFLDKIDHKDLAINLSVDGLDERIDLNTETVLYRVIQESVNNAIKHADARNLDISIFRDKDGISATIEDNGKGFDPDQQKENDGIGLKNIRTRVEYLKGTVDIDSAPGRGTVVSLHIPLN
jgi:signal transduction histidine kinase